MLGTSVCNMPAYNGRAYAGASYASLGSGGDSGPPVDPLSYAEEVIADSPVRFFRLKETSGTAAIDEMGNASGTYSGGHTLNQAAFTADGASVHFDATATPGGMVNCNFTTDYIYTLSIEFMINIDATGNDVLAHVISKSHFYANATTELPVAVRYVPASQKIVFALNQGSSFTATKELQSPAMTPGVDYHVVCRYKANDFCDILFDRVVVATSTIAFSINSDPTRNWRIATPQENAGGVGTGSFKGRLAEVAIYSHILSQSRIDAHYDAIGVSP